LPASNCRSCHENIYQEFLRSRHAAPSWAAVHGAAGLSKEQVAFSEQFQPGGSNRPPNPLTLPEGHPSVTADGEQCHRTGKPNSDGTIGMCIECPSRHTSSAALARNLVALAWGRSRSVLGAIYTWAHPAGESSRPQ
jgi:hypothetical protein